jgi:uncharacterized protein involved in exopolysaccharide biosynthesis
MVHRDQYSSEREPELNFLDVLTVLVVHRRLLVILPLVIGLAALGVSFLMKPTFTAKTVFLPPQQQQGAAASALASLGSLAGLMGAAAGGIKTTGDQYVALLQSRTIADHIIDRFDLMKVYEAKYRFAARNTLAGNVHIDLGKKDGLISIEVNAQDPKLAADIANEYVAALRNISERLQLTEAQQRRAFYQTQLERTNKQLAAAQTALQVSGFNPGALKAEPKAAADAYARLQAALTDGEVKLQAMRHNLADSAPEVQAQLGMLAGLREQLKRVEAQTPSESDADYIGKYREYKYQEALFDLFSKQFEMAKLDESRDSGLFEVVDPATPPEYKSKPRRAFIAIGATLASGVLMIFWFCMQALWQQTSMRPENARRVARLHDAWAGKRI